MVLREGGGVCSGVVIAQNIVLTAGHCVQGRIRVHYRDGSTPVLIAPQTVAVHPGYVANAVEARKRSIDLALIRLFTPLPARFAPIAFGGSALAEDALTIGGFGLAGDDPRSGGTFRSAPVRAIEPYGPSAILLWAEGNGAGACEGDSGGMIVKDDILLAITGWADRKTRESCGTRFQGVLVEPHRRWIERIMKDGKHP